MTRLARREMTDEERAHIVGLRRGGQSYKAIALACDRPQGTINAILSVAILNGDLPRRYARGEPRSMLSYA